MRKKLFLVAFVAILTQTVSAQVTVQRDYGQQNSSVQSRVKDNSERVSTFAYKFGVKAGLNLSTMSNGIDDFEPGFKMGAGFRIGGLVNLRWGQRTENSLPGTGWFGLQPEILYSMMQVGSDTESIKLNTLQMPIMVKLYPTTQLSFEVGPEFSYIFSTSPDDITFTQEHNEMQVNTGDINGMSFGIGAGIAYDFDKGFTVGARYSYGFNKLAKNLDWKHNNIQISIGWLF